MRALSPALALALLSACASPASPPTDASADSAANTDASADSAASTDASASDGGCSDFNGGFAFTGTCSQTAVRPFRGACITQRGCTAQIMLESGPTVGAVVGNRLNFQFNGPLGVVRCDATIDGAGGVQTFCDVDDGFATCMGTATRATDEGSSRWCCAPSDPAACSAGEKCTATSPAGMQIFSACRAAGAIAEGQPCTRTPDLAGHDSCAPGLYCANYNNNSTSMRTCQRQCTQRSECADNEACIYLTGTPRIGICSRACTLGGADCAAGTCRVERSWPRRDALDRDAVLQTYCGPIGAIAEGQPCVGVNDCAANLACGSDTSGVFLCRRPCSATLACPMGSSCSQTNATPTNPLALGLCLPD